MQTRRRLQFSLIILFTLLAAQAVHAASFMDAISGALEPLRGFDIARLYNDYGYDKFIDFVLILFFFISVFQLKPLQERFGKKTLNTIAVMLSISLFVGQTAYGYSIRNIGLIAVAIFFLGIGVVVYTLIVEKFGSKMMGAIVALITVGSVFTLVAPSYFSIAYDRVPMLEPLIKGIVPLIILVLLFLFFVKRFQTNATLQPMGAQGQISAGTGNGGGIFSRLFHRGKNYLQQRAQRIEQMEHEEQQLNEHNLADLMRQHNMDEHIANYAHAWNALDAQQRDIERQTIAAEEKQTQFEAQRDRANEVLEEIEKRITEFQQMAVSQGIQNAPDVNAKIAEMNQVAKNYVNTIESLNQNIIQTEQEIQKRRIMSEQDVVREKQMQNTADNEDRSLLKSKVGNIDSQKRIMGFFHAIVQDFDEQIRTSDQLRTSGIKTRAVVDLVSGLKQRLAEFEKNELGQYYQLIKDKIQLSEKNTEIEHKIVEYQQLQNKCVSLITDLRANQIKRFRQKYAQPLPLDQRKKIDEQIKKGSAAIAAQKQQLIQIIGQSSALRSQLKTAQLEQLASTIELQWRNICRINGEIGAADGLIEKVKAQILQVEQSPPILAKS